MVLRLHHFCLITGASVPCCQGSNPQPLASAICGHYFNIAPDVTNAAYNAAICGKYNMACECYRIRQLLPFL